jgi:hypothetical protein
LLAVGRRKAESHLPYSESLSSRVTKRFRRPQNSAVAATACNLGTVAVPRAPVPFSVVRDA